MKTTKKFTLVIFTTVLISWNHANYSTKEWSTHSLPYLHGKTSEGFTEAEETAFNAMIGISPPEFAGRHPAAEDVLIQRIPGDNNQRRGVLQATRY